MTSTATKLANFAAISRKVVCVGRNFVAHAEELGNAVPTTPIIFLKPPSSFLTYESSKPIELPKVGHLSVCVCVCSNLYFLVYFFLGLLSVSLLRCFSLIRIEWVLENNYYRLD